MKFISRQRHTLAYRVFSLFLSFTFVFSFLVPPSPVRAQGVVASVLSLPPAGTMIAPTAGFAPALMTGLTIHPENPLMFDFIIEEGDNDLEGDGLRDESRKLIKYFLAALTVPEEELWVNLSPYEQDRIIPQGFGDTEMGRDLLAQDYLLKQLAASLMYPEDELGKEFWGRVYQKANELYGTTEIPLNTFNKIWIVPDKAVILEHGASAFVIESHLKVMLEEDYTALKSNLQNAKFGLDHVPENDAGVISGVASDVVREVLIPAIEEEVNKGKTFANLRQVYNSMILATWYKKNLKDSLLGQVYADQNKTKGIDTDDKEINRKIYDQYLDAFQKGVYNYIRKDYDTASKRTIPRKYFSGGFDGAKIKAVSQAIRVDDIPASSPARIVEALRHRDAFPTADRAVLDGQIGATFSRFSADEQRLILQQVAVTPTSKINRVNAVFVEDTNPAHLARAVQPLQFRASSPVSNDSYMGVSQDVALGHVDAYRQAKLTFSAADLGFKTALDRALQYLNIRNKILNVQIIEDAGQPGETLFGAVLADDGKSIIFERSFFNEILGKGSPFDMETRVFINLLSKGTAYEKRVREYEYAKKVDPKGVTRLLPRDGVTIEDILDEIQKNILPLAGAGELAEGPFLKTQKTVVVPPDERTLQLAEELRTRASEALYKIAVSAMNKEIDTQRRIRLSDDDAAFTDEEKEGEPVTVGTLAYAGHPPSIAHILIAGLQAMAESKADRFILLLTRADYRKPYLLQTYNERFALSQQLLGEVFKGLITLMPTLKEDNDPVGGLNGEEKILPFIRLNQDIKLNVLYGAGGDHDFVFSRQKGQLQWTPLSNDSKYYIQKTGYRDLIRRFLQSYTDEIPQEKRKILEKMVASDQPPGTFLESQITTEGMIPGLDTIGKLFLLQQEVANPERHRIGMISTTRQAAGRDQLRDEIVRQQREGDVSTLFIVTNQGLADEISSTLIREALIEFARTGKINVNKFSGIPTKILELLFSNQFIKYTRSLLRKEEPVLPKAVRTLLPRGSQQSENERKWDTLVDAIRDIEPNVLVDEDVQGNESVIRVWRTDGRGPVPGIVGIDPGSADELPPPMVEVKYSVRSTLQGTRFEAPPYAVFDEGHRYPLDTPAIVQFVGGYMLAHEGTRQEGYADMKIINEDSTLEGNLYRVRRTVLGDGKSKEIDYMVTVKSYPTKIHYTVLEDGKETPALEYEESKTAHEQIFDMIKGYAKALNKLGAIDEAEPNGTPGTGGGKASSPMAESTAASVNPGGIDLNPALLDLQIKRDGNGVPLPLPQQPIGEMHIEGFVPVIINIQLVPVSPVPFLSGAGEPEKQANDLSFNSFLDPMRSIGRSPFASRPRYVWQEDEAGKV